MPATPSFLRTRPLTSTLTLACLLSLGACVGGGESANQSAGNITDTPAAVNPSETTPETSSDLQNRFNVANQCYTLQSLANGKWVKKDSSGAWTASVDSQSLASPLYLKPSELGKYMLFGKDSDFMAVSGAAVSTAATPSDSVIWSLQESGSELFSWVADTNNLRLATDGAGKLVLKPAADRSDATVFKLVKAQGCTEFPEITTNLEGQSFKGNGIDKPALGFADVHNHLTTTHFLGGVHSGSPTHKFGVTHALGDCREKHGENGRLDLVNNFLSGSPTDSHETVGWPTFNSWPAPKSLSHEGLYYKWLERSWQSGLRLFVTNLVENEVLCKLVAASQRKPNANCNEMDSAVSQIDDTYAIQNYIDAQSGGPGKGWFRVVTSPAEARKVINDGKLAVVLGIEISHLFNCTYKNGVDGCTRESVDKEIDKLYNRGVRQMFPIHEFNNALGGNGIFDGLVLNGGNFLDTGEFWKTYDCPEQKYVYGAGADMGTAVPGVGADPLSQAILAQTGGRLPVYKQGKQCNTRGLTPIGEYAFRKLMEKKVIIEIDHLELSIKTDLLNLAAAQKPAYPVVSTHGGHGGISETQAKKIFDVGGIIYPYHGHGASWVGQLGAFKQLSSSKYQFAMGYGADTNGLGSQAGPSGKNLVKYPFTLFSGAEFADPKFANAKPLKFNQQTSGKRVYDVNKDGQAHYGLKADFVEEVRVAGGKEAINALYDSAEVYLQMWERTVNR